MKNTLRMPAQVALACLIALAPYSASAQSKAARAKEEAATKDTASADSKTRKTSGKTAPSAPVDLNNASQADLEKIPGVGTPTAKKIIAGRPYSSVGDLSKAGISAKTIQEITPMVMVGRAAASSPKSTPTSMPMSSGKSNAAPSSMVDLNTASQADLDKLPGVGAVTAKKIIAGRPYSSVADLSKAGIPAKTIQTITPMVMVGAATASSMPRSTPPAMSKAAPNNNPVPAAAPAPVMPNRPNTSNASAGASIGTPGPGQVWVNLETKVFHRTGSKWYGNTKKGKYMSEADAVKAGYRESKEN